jgi:primosomal replication protein N''
MTGLIRRCPKCKGARPLNEIVCQTVREDGVECSFPLLGVRPTANITIHAAPRGSPATEERPPIEDSRPRCPNGHAIEDGDSICMTCGADVLSPTVETEPAPQIVIGEWIVLDVLDDNGSEADLYRVRSEGDPSPRLMRYFAHGVEPESRTYPAIIGIDTPRLANLIASGRTEGRAYEVWDDIDGETLAATLLGRPFSPNEVREIVQQIAVAIIALESRNLRHGSLNPCAIRFRSLDPIDVQVGELSTATLSEFRLETARVRPLSRYVSPESMAGASSPASDWWSLGIIVLELLTGGRYFEQVNDRAFLLSVVARSLELPTDVGDDWTLLLKGLLTRDHDKRWCGTEVKRWLAGDRDIPVHFEIIAGESVAGPTLSLGGQPYRESRSFALAAALAENWEEALALTEMGSVASWLAAIGTDSAVLRRFKQLMEERRLERDYRFAIALLCLNEHLPLSLRGEIQTPNRFLEQPEEAAPWLEKASVNALTQLGREAWIVRMAERAARIRARAEELDITLVETRFRVAQLAAFESRLADFWRQRQRLFPDSTVTGLAALLERRILTDEDLILLICADDLSFRSGEQVVAEAKVLANGIGVEFDEDKAREDCARSKRELIDRVKERVGAFKRTDRAPLNEWADILRLGRRLPLDRLLILHATPESQWKEPPHQDYLHNVLEFLQKKIVSNLQRGPLLKLMIGRSASRLDLTDLGDQDFVTMLIERVISRDDQPVNLDASETIEAHELIDRLRRISTAADLYRRETGVSALVLAFPLITFDDESLTGASSIRIAPLALWPVKIIGQGGKASISYDGERDVELNPALERVLGATTANAWLEKFEFIMRDGVQSIAEVIEAFRGLTARADPALRPIPNQSEINGKYQPELIAAGALILADFPSQSIVGDLRTILAKPMNGSVLPYLLRIVEPEYPAATPRPAEEERFTTLEADPSQEQAVLAARHAPGVKLEGPPGTGKSQTIVNIIADCMGRGESVMLVCEKQVALEVVYKRLQAEGLSGRVVRIENTQTDRKRLLEQLQNQIPHALQTPVSTHNEIRTQRRQIAAAIDQLEEELSRYHAAVYDASQRLGLSYRDVVARIATHEQAVKELSAPTLRSVLGALEPAQLERIVGECLGLLEVWYQADFTDDTLALFRKFETDPALEARLTADLQSAELAENERRVALEIAGPMTGLPANADSNEITLWRHDHEQTLRTLSPQAREIISAWRHVLEFRDERPPSAPQLRARLEQLINRLTATIPNSRELAVYAPLARAAEQILVALETHASLFSANRSLLARLNPVRGRRRNKVRNILQTLGIPVDDATAAAACTAAGKERALRQARGFYEGLRGILGLKTDVAHLGSVKLRDDVKNVAAWLDYAIDAASRIIVSPWPSPLWSRLSPDDDEWASAFVRMAAAEDLLRGTQRAKTLFASLSSWIEPGWLEQRYDELSKHRPLSIDFVALFEALQRLAPYQIFRRTGLSGPATAVFNALLALRVTLCRLSPEDRCAAIEALIRREAAYAWAEEIRQERPILVQPPETTEWKVEQLRKMDHQIRMMNKQVLGIVDSERLAPVQKWSQIWQIGGRNAQRLRQVFESGRDLGLLAARPIWLVSPDVVSRIFPLEAGLFDVVIFDEASQMRVENAVAALYRAKRAIISGDSKQLPPTKFFGTSVTDDDETGLEELVGEDADSEIADRKREETAKRRHVKDCPDLLKLSEGVLPEQPLVIHYRSSYRELIDFSNAAYYAGQLNVPVRRPIADVHRHRPIEVRRIDGVYAGQTNKDEAKAVVAYLAEMWRENTGKPPTVGVVTFNLKQAELIDQAVQEMARGDRTFRTVLEREQVRKADGEDVSFFIRNLENVQGDERDLIIFSTTFGRDSEGRFKRSFGVLTQEGGERRLNVAVTRAKTKVVLMTSMPTEEISDFPNDRRSPTKARDYLGAYLRYAERVHDGELDEATELLASFNGKIPHNPPPARDNDSDALVQTIRDVLEGAGHETVLLPSEDAFSVDIAVVHPKTKLYSLGVELDGPRHHVLNSARARDLWRPKVLERSGMRVHRVYSAAWASNTAQERGRLLEAAKRAEERAIT